MDDSSVPHQSPALAGPRRTPALNLLPVSRPRAVGSSRYKFWTDVYRSGTCRSSDGGPRSSPTAGTSQSEFESLRPVPLGSRLIHSTLRDQGAICLHPQPAISLVLPQEVRPVEPAMVQPQLVPPDTAVDLGHVPVHGHQVRRGRGLLGLCDQTLVRPFGVGRRSRRVVPPKYVGG